MDFGRLFKKNLYKIGLYDLRWSKGCKKTFFKKICEEDLVISESEGDKVTPQSRSPPKAYEIRKKIQLKRE